MNPTKPPQAVVIASGKGGTGKSTLALNLSVALAERGKRVALLDANLELPSLATLLNLIPKHTLTDLIEGRCSLDEVIVSGPKGITLILGSSLPNIMRNLSSAYHFGIVNALNTLSSNVDILIVDTAPGLNHSTLNFLSASHDILLIINNEPTAIACNKVLINLLRRQHCINNFRIVINKVMNVREGRRVFDTLQREYTEESDVFLHYAGHVHTHKHARSAAKNGRTLYELYPTSEFTKDIKKLAHNIEQWPSKETPTGRIEFFMDGAPNAASSEPPLEGKFLAHTPID